MRIRDWSSDVCSSDLPADYLAELDSGVQDMRFAWTDDFGYADMYAMPDSPAIIAKIRAAAQGFASIGGKAEQPDEVWEDFFPGFIAPASGIGHNYPRQTGRAQA